MSCPGEAEVILCGMQGFARAPVWSQDGERPSNVCHTVPCGVAVALSPLPVTFGKCVQPVRARLEYAIFETFASVLHFLVQL